MSKYRIVDCGGNDFRYHIQEWRRAWCGLGPYRWSYVYSLLTESPMSFMAVEDAERVINGWLSREAHKGGKVVKEMP